MLRLLPPLNCTAEEIDTAGRILRQALAAALHGNG